MNISIIIRLVWNQFRCLVQYSVHKRITVSSEQGQDNNKQMFVVNKFITDIMNYKLQKSYSKWLPFTWIQRRSLLGHSSIAVWMTSIGKLQRMSNSFAYFSNHLPLMQFLQLLLLAFYLECHQNISVQFSAGLLNLLLFSSLLEFWSPKKSFITIRDHVWRKVLKYGFKKRERQREKKGETLTEKMRRSQNKRQGIHKHMKA